MLSCFYKKTISPHQFGFAYIEVLVATAILAMSLIPAMNALSGSMQAGEIHIQLQKDYNRLQSKIDEVLAEPFSLLDEHSLEIGSPVIASTLFSDPALSDNRRVVYMSRYDADNVDGDNNPFTGMDESILWIKVELVGGYSQETLITNI